MKFVLIPDSFKGTLSSEQICEIAKEKVEKHFPGAETACVPVADGGEGSVDAFITALGGSKVTVKVKNPYFEDMDSYYGLINEGKTAVIEMASCAGLPLVEDRKDPRKTTTYGVGQLILAAAESGVEKIIVGLGGSSTNDGGCGAAAAVGVKFYDKDGKEFVPTGGTTADICKIDLSGKAEILNKVEIVTMCDIDNPMYGPTGASHIFASSPLTFSTVTSTLPLSLKRSVTVVPLAAGVSSRSNSSITCLNNMVNCLLRYKMIYGIFAHYIQFIAKCDMGQ